MTVVSKQSISEYQIIAGDSIRLRYYNGYYYILDKRVTYE